jgi:hypothetical protein
LILINFPGGGQGSGNLDHLSSIGLSTNTADSLFIDSADAGPITARDAFGEIDRFLFLYRSPAPAAEKALVRNPFITILAGNR